MQFSDGTQEILPELLQVQKEVGDIIKNAKDDYLKRMYADINVVLETVKPVLNSHGLVLFQPVDVDESGTVVNTMIMHAKSGQYISSCTPVIFVKERDPKAMGSGITYSRRYALMSLLGLATKDDDGDAASKERKGAKAGRMGDDMPSNIPEPTEEAAKLLHQVCNLLKDIAPEGKAVDYELLRRSYYATNKNSYKIDEDRVSGIAAYFGKFVEQGQLCRDANQEEEMEDLFNQAGPGATVVAEDPFKDVDPAPQKPKPEKKPKK